MDLFAKIRYGDIDGLYSKKILTIISNVTDVYNNIYVYYYHLLKMFNIDIDNHQLKL